MFQLLHRLSKQESLNYFALEVLVGRFLQLSELVPHDSSLCATLS